LLASAVAGAPAAGGPARARISREGIATMVHEAVAAVLGPDVNPDEPLMASGLDSLGAVELRNALQAQIGSELPATLLFDYPSINAVTGFLAEQVGAYHQLSALCVKYGALKV
jgi:acyl carrier protein